MYMFIALCMGKIKGSGVLLFPYIYDAVLYLPKCAVLQKI